MDKELEARLDVIEGQLHQMSMGLYPDPTERRRFFLNRRHNSLMYEIVDGEVNQINGGLVFGRLIDIYDKVYQRRDEAHKLILVVQADIRYELEMGFNTNPARSILGNLSNASSQELSRPLQFRPRAGDEDDMVIFLNAYTASGERFDSDYLTSETTDKELHQRKFKIAFAINAFALDWMIERDGKKLISESTISKYGDYIDEVVEGKDQPHQPSNNQGNTGGAGQGGLPKQVEDSVREILQYAKANQGSTCAQINTNKGTLADRIEKMARYLNFPGKAEGALFNHFGIGGWGDLVAENVQVALDCIADEDYLEEVVT